MIILFHIRKLERIRQKAMEYKKKEGQNFLFLKVLYVFLHPCMKT